MLIFLLWLLLLVFCWPLALLVLVLYPLVWLILLPFRLAGFAVEGVLELLRALLLLPARIISGGPRAAYPPYPPPGSGHRDPRSRWP
jgi:hypothetical protein